MEKIPPHDGPETGYFLKLVIRTARHTFLSLRKFIAICSEMATYTATEFTLVGSSL